MRANVALGAVAVALALLCAPAGAVPMQGGGDTADPSHMPLVAFSGPPISVKPGESGLLAFTIANRYNQSMDSVRVTYAFRVGGDWLEARAINDSFPEAPRFSAAPPLPAPIAQAGTMRVEAPFNTTPRTPGGVYLISLTLVFQYVNETGARVDARFASLGSIDAAQRADVDPDDLNGSAARFGLDGWVPDFSITVNAGGALSTWWLAAGFGAAVVGAGVAYGTVKHRRFRKKGR